MAEGLVGAPVKCASDFQTVEELGIAVSKISALLRAAVNTGAGARADEAWLVGLAFDQAEEARELYVKWGER